MIIPCEISTKRFIFNGYCSRIVRIMQYDYKYYAVVVEIFIGTQDDGESIDP